MEINHLQYFEKALYEWDKLYAYFQSEPLSIAQIEVIEKAIYKTESQKLPIVLRELLFLTGGFCPFFTTGTQPSEKNTLDIDDLLEEQNLNRYFATLEERNDALSCFKGRIIWRFDTYYESTDRFYFVYLDEDTSDPFVYSFDGDKFLELYDKGETDFRLLIEPTDEYLSNYIHQLYIDYMKYNSVRRRPVYDESIFSTYLHSNTKQSKYENLQNFYDFIAEGNLSGVNYFIEQGIDVTANNNQAILNAATVADLEGIELLIKHGADLYTQNEKVLLIAAIIGKPMFLQDLIGKYEFSQINKNRALVIVCSQGIRTSTFYMVRGGAEVNGFNSLALQIALRNHHFSLVTELVYEFEVNKNANSGFLLLFKQKMTRADERLFEGVNLTQSKSSIIKSHYADLRAFYGDESVVLKEFPLKITIELEKFKNR